MARSYKHHFVCTSHDSLKADKQIYNRRFRRRLNRGDFDDYSFTKGTQFKKIENFDWVIDRFYHYVTFDELMLALDKSIPYDERKDILRWYIRK